MKQEEIKTAFKSEAKMIVDSLFESKCFHDKITRDDMSATEDFISFSMDSRYNLNIKASNLLKRIEQSKK